MSKNIVLLKLLNQRIYMNLKIIALISCLFYGGQAFSQTEEDKKIIRQIYDEALEQGAAYEDLRDLCKNIGARLSGSKELEQAVIWGEETLEALEPDAVFKQAVLVPKWIRTKKENGYFYSNQGRVNMDISALGGSVGTGTNNQISASVIEVQGIEDLANMDTADIKGKFVFFNKPFNEKLINTFHAYGGCVNQRWGGASEAAKYGAIGVLVRSLTNAHDHFAHTGSLGYEDPDKAIPAAAISTETADLLSTQLKNDSTLTAYMKLGCYSMDDAESHNVVAEIKGSTFPDKYITIGAHLDSWDLGEGAHDDGAGIVQTIEVLRIFKLLDIQPKHSIRFVLFTNEENGARGAKRYAQLAEQNGEKHVAAIESDCGGFSPRGFNLDASPKQMKMIRAWKKIVEPYGLHYFEKGHTGVDIGPLKKNNPNIILMGLHPDSQRYFDFHHADSDVFESVNRRELELGAASIASILYLLDKNMVN